MPLPILDLEALQNGVFYGLLIGLSVGALAYGIRMVMRVFKILGG